MGRRRRRSRGDSLDPATSHIAIIGSGLTGLATALQLEREYGFQKVTIYERDEALSARKEGYGLTLTYHPTGVLQTLQILNDLADAECPSRSHYLLDSTGDVRGYFGSAFAFTGASSKGYGQRGNLRVPRQRVRHILASKLQTTVICWSHKLVGMHDVLEDGIGTSTSDHCTNGINGINDSAASSSDDAATTTTASDGAIRLTFANGHVATADVVIAADGIRSSVVSLWIPSAPPPQSLGVRIILGLTQHKDDIVAADAAAAGSAFHQLLQERGFYTLGPRHRLFVMPYTGSALCRSLDADEPVRFMWQLSFSCDDNDSDSDVAYHHHHTGNSCARTGQDLLTEAMDRTRDWHDPVQTLMQSTPPSCVWGCMLHDRDPVAIQRHLQQRAVNKHSSSSSSSSSSMARVIVAGDALHAMSPFKGQGANQCLRDGLAIAQWLASAAVVTAASDPVDEAASLPSSLDTTRRIAPISLSVAVTGVMREMAQRTASIVAASRVAAQYWHSSSCTTTAKNAVVHPFAGLTCENDIDRLLAELKQQSINAGTTPHLDRTIRSIMLQLGFRQDHDTADMAAAQVDDVFAHEALHAASVGATHVLRRLSWEHPHWIRLVVGTIQTNDPLGTTTCLHAAAAAGHVATVHWLVTEAGCESDVVDGLGRSVYDVSQPLFPAVGQLLNRLSRKDENQG